MLLPSKLNVHRLSIGRLTRLTLLMVLYNGLLVHILHLLFSRVLLTVREKTHGLIRFNPVLQTCV